jgi:hypothetical protein
VAGRARAGEGTRIHRLAPSSRPGANRNLVVQLHLHLLAVAVWSLIIYYVAISRRLPGDRVDEYVAEVYPSCGGVVG